MAGAGYKLFNTGDVLTAAQVNTYLMEQTVMVFASAAARTSALSGVLAEGMVSYLQDTNTLEVYDGSNWVGATGDITGLTAGTGISISSATGPVPTITNDVATEFDAKGDLVVGTGADAFDRLAAGSNGDTLVANSSATTGLAWASNFAAGKNKIINGDFRINQRNFTSTTTGATYGFDRFYFTATDGTTTYSAQTFTAGSAPVAGYEAINFARIVSSGQTLTTAQSVLRQAIEDVRTLAGQSVTVSFWARSGSATPAIAVELIQDFGSGGSSAVIGIISTKQTISTSWTRYTWTGTVPSISGKTIGSNSLLQLAIWCSAGSNFDARTQTLGIQSNTFDIWGVQVEAGSVATAFQTATGTLAGELAACQRYYWRSVTGNAYARHPGAGAFADATTNYHVLNCPVQMRVSPTSVDFSNLTLYDYGADRAVTNVTLTANQQSPNAANLTCTVASGGVQYRPTQLTNANNANGYIGLSAEL